MIHVHVHVCYRQIVVQENAKENSDIRGSYWAYLVNGWDWETLPLQGSREPGVRMAPFSGSHGL